MQKVTFVPNIDGEKKISMNKVYASLKPFLGYNIRFYSAQNLMQNHTSVVEVICAICLAVEVCAEVFSFFYSFVAYYTISTCIADIDFGVILFLLLRSVKTICHFLVHFLVDKKKKPCSC